MGKKAVEILNPDVNKLIERLNASLCEEWQAIGRWLIANGRLLQQSA